MESVDVVLVGSSALTRSAASSAVAAGQRVVVVLPPGSQDVPTSPDTVVSTQIESEGFRVLTASGREFLARAYVPEVALSGAGYCSL